MGSMQLSAAEVASLVDRLAAHIETQQADPDSDAPASPTHLSQLLAAAPNQLQDPKDHPLLAKLRGAIGDLLGQEHGPAFQQAGSSAAPAPDVQQGPQLQASTGQALCSPAAVQAFLEPLLAGPLLVAALSGAKQLVTAQAALIDWEDENLLKVDSRRQPQTRQPDILTFSDTDSDGDGDRGKGSAGQLGEVPSSSAQAPSHMSRRCSTSSLLRPAGSLSLLLGSMDDSDSGDFDLADFGPDVGKLVKEMDTPELRVAALKKLTSGRVYPEDLCHGPSWQHLFDSLGRCLMAPAPAAAPAAAGGPGVAGGEGDGAAAQQHDEAEVRPLACMLLQRLVPECSGGSPLHAAHLLLVLEAALLQLRLAVPAGFRARGPQADDGGQGSTGAERAQPQVPVDTLPSITGGALLLQLQQQQPVDVQLSWQAHKLLTAVSKDWHLVKAPAQGRLAACICRLLAAGLHGPPAADAAAPPAPALEPGEGPGGGELRAAHMLLLMDPRLAWLQRLAASASSCRVLRAAAMEVRFAPALLALLTQPPAPAPAPAGAGAGQEAEAWVGSMSWHLALQCAGCLAAVPHSSSEEGPDWPSTQLVHQLVAAMCQFSSQQLQPPPPPEAGELGGDGGGGGDGWQQRCPCWVVQLVSIASCQPRLLAGPSVGALLGQLLAGAKAGAGRVLELSAGAGHWWLDAAAALLQQLEASGEGRRALLACKLRQARPSHPSSGTGGAGVAPAEERAALSCALALIEAQSKAMAAGAAGPPLPQAARACLGILSRLLGSSAAPGQLHGVGALADAALRLVKRERDGAGSSSMQVRRPGGGGGAAVRCFSLKSSSTASGGALDDADARGPAAGGAGGGGGAEDVLVALCSSPLAALQVCRRPAAAQACAQRICQLLAALHRAPGQTAAPGPGGPAAPADGGGAAGQQEEELQQQAEGAFSAASMLALTTAGQQALIAQGLPALVHSWLRAASEVPDLAMCLQLPPSHCPALAPLTSAQAVLSWHRLGASLSTGPSGQELLRVLVTWLDTNPGVRPPPTSGADQAQGLDSAAALPPPPPPPPRPSSQTGTPAPSAAAAAAEQSAGPPYGGAPAPVPAPLAAVGGTPRTPEACHLSLRCLAPLAADTPSLLVLDRATNLRWYLRQLLDTACGPPLDLRMEGIVTEPPLALPGRPAPAPAPDPGPSSGLSEDAFEAPLDMDSAAAGYLLARMELLGPPPPQQRRAPGPARDAGAAGPGPGHVGRPPSTPGSLLDPSADHLAQVVCGDPGMCESGQWLSAVRRALCSDVQLPFLSPLALALMLQRLVMVALQAPAKQLHGLHEAAWAPSCQTSAAVGMQFRGAPGSDQKQPSAQLLHSSWSCTRTALSVHPQQLLPGFCLDLALAAPAALLASATPEPWGAASATAQAVDPLAPFQLLGSYLAELRHGPACLPSRQAQAEAAAQVLGLPPGDLAAAHARLSAAVAGSSLMTEGQGGGGDAAAAGSGAGSSGPDWFLLWVSGLMGHKGSTLELLAALSQSPACVYWWPCFGAIAQGDAPRLALCAGLQLVLAAAEPRLWGCCVAAGLHPGHAASRWTESCFFGYLPPAEASKALALALALGPDYLVYCCAAMMKYMDRELLQGGALYGLLPQLLQSRLLPDFAVGAHLQYMTDLEKQYRGQVLAILFPSFVSAS